MGDHFSNHRRPPIYCWEDHIINQLVTDAVSHRKLSKVFPEILGSVTGSSLGRLPKGTLVKNIRDSGIPLPISLWEGVPKET